MSVGCYDVSTGTKCKSNLSLPLGQKMATINGSVTVVLWAAEDLLLFSRDNMILRDYL
jgi:hypothetical protein